MRDHGDRCVLYHSGELSEPERLAFEGHLASCPACRELLDALGLGARAAEAALLPLPEAARLRAAGALRAPAADLRPLAALAVAVALALLAAWPSRPGATPTWRELDRDLARLGDEVDRFADRLARSETELEIDADFRGLERESRRLAAGL